MVTGSRTGNRYWNGDVDLLQGYFRASSVTAPCRDLVSLMNAICGDSGPCYGSKSRFL